MTGYYSGLGETRGRATFAKFESTIAPAVVVGG